MDNVTLFYCREWSDFFRDTGNLLNTLIMHVKTNVDTGSEK